MNTNENNIGKIGRTTATYLRVSTSAQEVQETIDNQRMSVKEYAEKNNLDIIQEYADDGWSGDTLLRPKLDQLRQDIKVKLWEVVLMYDPDRLARRYSYQELVMDEIKEAGIEVVFVNQPAPKDGFEKILFGVTGLFAEYERTKIAERFRLGKLRKVREGYILTSSASYGHTYIRNDKETKKHGYYVVNEKEADVIKEICSWIDIDNLTLRKVVKKLQEKGIKPRRNKNGVWNTSTLSTLLRNKVLIGEAHYGALMAIVPLKPFKQEKYKKMKKTSRRTRPESEWTKIPVPPIIDVALFNRVQEKLKRNAQLAQRNKKNNYLLSGKIHCSCGKTRAGEGPQHGKYLYYRCSDRVLSFPLPPTCKEGGLNAKIADNLFWMQIVELMSSPKMMMQQVSRWMIRRQNKGKFTVDDIEVMKKEVAKLKDTEDRYNKAYGVGLFSMERLKEYLDPVREKVSSLESQISKGLQEKSEMEVLTLPSEQEIEVFAERAKKFLKNLNFESKQAIVKSVIGRLTANQKQLDAHGAINMNEIYVLFSNVAINPYVGSQTIHRHRGTTERRQVHAF